MSKSTSISESYGIVCKEVFDDNSGPSPEEVQKYARKIGVDPAKEPHLVPLAKEGLMLPLPKLWKPVRDEITGNFYYYNTISRETQWEHPVDEEYRQKVNIERMKMNPPLVERKNNKIMLLPLKTDPVAVKPSDKPLFPKPVGLTGLQQRISARSLDQKPTTIIDLSFTSSSLNTLESNGGLKTTKVSSTMSSDHLVKTESKRRTLGRFSETNLLSQRSVSVDRSPLEEVKPGARSLDKVEVKPKAGFLSRTQSEERKNVRFDLDRNLDIKFSISDSEQESKVSIETSENENEEDSSGNWEMNCVKGVKISTKNGENIIKHTPHVVIMTKENFKTPAVLQVTEAVMPTLKNSKIWKSQTSPDETRFLTIGERLQKLGGIGKTVKNQISVENSDSNQTPITQVQPKTLATKTHELKTLGAGSNESTEAPRKVTGTNKNISNNPFLIKEAPLGRPPSILDTLNRVKKLNSTFAPKEQEINVDGTTFLTLTETSILDKSVVDDRSNTEKDILEIIQNSAKEEIKNTSSTNVSVGKSEAKVTGGGDVERTLSAFDKDRTQVTGDVERTLDKDRSQVTGDVERTSDRDRTQVTGDVKRTLDKERTQVTGDVERMSNKDLTDDEKPHVKSEPKMPKHLMFFSKMTEQMKAKPLSIDTDSESDSLVKYVNKFNQGNRMVMPKTGIKLSRSKTYEDDIVISDQSEGSINKLTKSKEPVKAIPKSIESDDSTGFDISMNLSMTESDKNGTVFENGDKNEDILKKDQAVDLDEEPVHENVIVMKNSNPKVVKNDSNHIKVRRTESNQSDTRKSSTKNIEETQALSKTSPDLSLNIENERSVSVEHSKTSSDTSVESQIQSKLITLTNKEDASALTNKEDASAVTNKEDASALTNKEEASAMSNKEDRIVTNVIKIVMREVAVQTNELDTDKKGNSKSTYAANFPAKRNSETQVTGVEGGHSGSISEMERQRSACIIAKEKTSQTDFIFMTRDCGHNSDTKCTQTADGASDDFKIKEEKLRKDNKKLEEKYRSLKIKYNKLKRKPQAENKIQDAVEPQFTSNAPSSIDPGTFTDVNTNSSSSMLFTNSFSTISDDSNYNNANVDVPPHISLTSQANNNILSENHYSYRPDNAKSPYTCIESLKNNLRKIDAMIELMPTHPFETTYFKYPFAGDFDHEGSTDISYIKHRLHIEQESVVKTKNALRLEEEKIKMRQRNINQGGHKRSMDHLVQEQDELTDAQINLHRSKSLLNEKVIRLRHIEESLRRLNTLKKRPMQLGHGHHLHHQTTQSAVPTIIPDQRYVNHVTGPAPDMYDTLSDLSSHSSGFSSTDVTSDHHVGSRKKNERISTNAFENSELQRSLENINSEIQGLRSDMNKKTQDNVVKVLPASMVLYPDIFLANNRSPVITGSPMKIVASRYDSQSHNQSEGGAVPRCMEHLYNRAGPPLNWEDGIQMVKEWLNRPRDNSLTEVNAIIERYKENERIREHKRKQSV